MQNITIKDFAQSIGIDLDIMEENSFIDISDKEKYILSYDELNNQQRKNKILKIIRKPNDKVIKITTNLESLYVTKEHKFFISKGVESNNEYLTVKDIISCINNNEEIFILHKEDLYDKILSIEQLNYKDKIFDLEVENDHNLFTENLLSHNSMGDPTTTSGGTALSFYSHVRIKITRSEIDKELQKNTMKFHFIKNKLATPFKVGSIVYKWMGGFDKVSEYADIAIEAGIIKIEGKSYYLPEVEDKLVGKKKYIEYLDNHPEYLEKVINPLVLDYLNNKEIVADENE